MNDSSVNLNDILKKNQKQKSVRIYSVSDTMSPTIAHCVNQHVALEKMHGRIVKRVQVTLYGNVVHHVKTIE